MVIGYPIFTKLEVAWTSCYILIDSHKSSTYKASLRLLTRLDPISMYGHEIKDSAGFYEDPCKAEAQLVDLSIDGRLFGRQARFIPSLT